MRIPAFTALLLPLLKCTVASAQPISRAGSGSGSGSLLTVPLRAASLLGLGLDLDLGRDPIIVHQQHINRGVQRLLSSQGQPTLSNGELLERLVHRMDVASLLNNRTSVLKSKVDHRTSLFEVDGNGNGNRNTSKKLGKEEEQQQQQNEMAQGQVRERLAIQAEDVGYYGPVEMGTPPRTMQLLMDSGSADLWVGAEDCRCDDGGSCGPHKFLGPSTSSTFNRSDDTWVLWYGTGAVAGHLVQDRVSIAGATVEGHVFGTAQNESRDFTGENIPFDGILGLAQSPASRQRTPTFLDALKSAGHIDRAIASYKIPRRVDGRDDGELTFGGMNPGRYDPGYVVTVGNVNTRGFWEVGIEDVKVDGRSVTLGEGWRGVGSGKGDGEGEGEGEGSKGRGREAVLDTGATLFMAPESDIAEIHKHIAGARYGEEEEAWVVPCDTRAVVSLTIGGREFPIRGEDVAWLPLDGDEDVEGDDDGDRGRRGRRGRECLSGISRGGVASEGPTHWLLGDVFLKNVYFSTDQDRNEVTLARLL